MTLLLRNGPAITDVPVILEFSLAICDLFKASSAAVENSVFFALVQDHPKPSQLITLLTTYPRTTESQKRIMKTIPL